MAGSVLLPTSAPFGADQISLLNTVIGVATVEQRAWLSGFLAGVQAANGPAAAAAPAAPPKPRVPLTILFGTESGNSEALAARARKAATKLGFSVKVVDMADTTPAKMADVSNLLLIAATWGEGDPPQRAVDFYEALLADDAPRFDKTKFAVLALGDRAYAQYCEVGRRIDERLAALGGTRVVDRIDCDLDFEAPAGSWIDATLDRIAKDSTETVLEAEDTSVIHVDFARAAVGEEAHLLVAGVRYETHGRARAGVASIDLNERRKAGDTVKVFLRPNPHFRLPADPARPVIMIGPGTGVAPFRGFMQEREATGAKGKNWLVFGHRNFMHDFLYQLEWQDWIKSGLLNRIDVAFSRDQPEKRYVQHVLHDAAADLRGWVADGAAIYVCGDAAAMAKDVHEALVSILGKDTLDQTRRDGRYLRDVY